MAGSGKRRLPLPKEHALWAWVGLPQVVAAVLAPGLGTLVVGLVLLNGILFGLGFAERRGLRFGKTAWLEVPGLVAFGGLGLATAVIFGAEPLDAAVRMAAITVWQIVGLWFVRGLLASVLKNRDGWPEGVPVSGALLVAGLGFAAWAGLPAIGGVPLFYGLRMILAPRPTSPKDVKRVGLTEAAWGTAAALVIGLA